MKKTVPYVIKPDSNITVYINGECITVTKDHKNYSKIVQVLKSDDHSSVDKLVNIVKEVAAYTASSGKVKISNGQIFYSDYPINTSLTARILDMMEQGFKFDHMVKFLENLMANPSKRAVEETYRFLENYGMPITDDGHFLAYKAVRNNYFDIYSGKFDNSIGKTPEMPRNFVDEDYERDCSHGLHVGALDYVVQYGHFVKGQAPSEDGNRLLIVKVNPTDVVSVPKYENHPKMRVCKYRVLSEIKDVVKELDKVVYSGTTAAAIAPDADEGDADSDYEQGYDAGNDASDYGDEFPSESTFKNAAYAQGFSDGYYGNEFNPPSNWATDGDDGDCDGCCSCCQCEEQVSGGEPEFDAEHEYNSGLYTGESDSLAGLPYQENCPIDSSDEFKAGYDAGWESKQ